MIFQRSLRAEFTSNTALIALVTIFFSVTIFLTRLVNEINVGRLEIESLGSLLAFAVLKFLPILLSLSCFLGILLTLSRWYRDSEMTIWLTSGMPLLACIRPILYFSFPLMIIVGVITHALLPWAYKASQSLREQKSQQNQFSHIRPGFFRESSDGLRVIYVEQVDQHTGAVRNIFISDNKKDGLGVVVAKSARQASFPNGDKFIILENGHRYDIHEKSYTLKDMAFAEYGTRVETDLSSALPNNRFDGTSTYDLMKIGSPQSLGDIVTRIGLMLMLLVLSLLAIPLSFVDPRAGRSAGMIMALLIYFAYYNLMTIARSWVMQQKIPFVLGLLAPHLAMLAVLAGSIYFRTRGVRR